MSIYTQLASSIALRAVVGAKIFPDVALKATAPYVIYSTVAGTNELLLEGGASFENVRYQVDCYATTKTQAEQIAELCRIAIEQNGYQLGRNPGGYETDTALFRASNDYELIELK